MKTKDEYIEFIKGVAERQVQRIATNNLSGEFAFFTEDSEVPRVVFFPHQQTGDPNGRNKITFALRLLSASIDNLSMIAFTSDTYQATTRTKTDGTAWEQGEMQEAFVNNTADAHLVSEALMYQVIERNGIATMVSVNYERNGDDITFDWDNASLMSEASEDEEEKGKLVGFIPDTIRASFEVPKLMKATEDAGFKLEDIGLSIDDARMHGLCAAVKIILNQIHVPCLILCRSDEEAELVRNSMSDGPFSENIRTFNGEQMHEIATLEEAFEQPSFVHNGDKYRVQRDDLGLTNQGDLNQG